MHIHLLTSPKTELIYIKDSRSDIRVYLKIKTNQIIF